jgi:hypothetical protein
LLPGRLLGIFAAVDFGITFGAIAIRGLRSIVRPLLFTDLVIGIDGDLNGVKVVAILSGLKPSCLPQSYPIGVRDAANGLEPAKLSESIELSVTAHGVRETPLKGVEVASPIEELGMKLYTLDADTDGRPATSVESKKWIERVIVLVPLSSRMEDSKLSRESAGEDDGLNPLQARGEMDTRFDFMSLMQPEFVTPLVKPIANFISRGVFKDGVFDAPVLACFGPSSSANKALLRFMFSSCESSENTPLFS